MTNETTTEELTELLTRTATMTMEQLVSLRESAERIADKLLRENADITHVAAAWCCWRIYSGIVAARRAQCST